METSSTASTLIADEFTKADKCLTDEEKQLLKEQDKRRLTDFKANQLEIQAQRNWDLFYKRNETNFFKDRRWTIREFEELNNDDNGIISTSQRRYLLEVGCGVGNLIYPLIEECIANNKFPFYFYACDFSPRAVNFVQANTLYNENYLKAFQCDITTQQISDNISNNSLDIITMIFVLSAIHPDKFSTVIKNLWNLLKPGGVVLFRDYGLYDMAQLRFKPGHKIAEQFYMRQDGTRSYFFAESELGKLFTENGFEIVKNSYVHRRTMNVKEGIDVPRIFLQGKFRKIVNNMES